MRIQKNYQSIKIQLGMKSDMEAKLLCVVQHEIVYEAELFNRLNPEAKPREFNLLNNEAE